LLPTHSMTTVPSHAGREPTRAEVDALAGATLLEFGTSWCGYCRRAQPLIGAALAGRSGVRHVKIEDGSGLPLGRSYGVKLWPTLVFLRDGKEAARLVRPHDSAPIARALATIAGDD
jgi:thioredoxin 1